jgi:hypothetical protein
VHTCCPFYAHTVEGQHLTFDLLLLAYFALSGIFSPITAHMLPLHASNETVSWGSMRALARRETKETLLNRPEIFKKSCMHAAAAACVH